MDDATSRARHVSTGDIARLVFGWGAFGVVQLAGEHLTAPVPAGTLVVALGAIVGVIVICAFGVVRQAEALAKRLGDPYGSLVLTLSIVLIEVILIVAVMLGPGDHTTIGRDSVMAVSMIILNLVIGLSIVLGSRRHRRLVVNRRGTVAYLAMITLLGGAAFALPRLIGERGSFLEHQEIPIIVGTVGLYAVFLYRQMGPRADDFREDGSPDIACIDGSRFDRPQSRRSETALIGRVIADHRNEVTVRVGVLVAMMIPIVLLSNAMARLLDDGLGRLGAPVALTGVLIAVVVFLPEGLTSVRAALAGETQRVSNLCHGALVSTLASTIPAVLVVGAITGEVVVLAELPGNLALLTGTIALSWLTFTARRITATNGIAHLALFVVYGLTLFV